MVVILKRYNMLLKEDYRHRICLLINFVSIVCVLIFPNSIPRLLESIFDLITSFLFYIFEIFGTILNPIYPTVIELQSFRIAEEIWKPIRLIPSNFDEFINPLLNFFSILFSIENLVEYWTFLSNFILFLSRFSLICLPLIPVIIVAVNNIKNKRCNDRNKKSVPLKTFQHIENKYIYPAVAWIKEFVTFVTYHNYHKIWLFIWLLHFNVFSIALSLLAFYFYFITSWDVFNIYVQLLKLQIDLTPILRFMPGIVWIIAVAIIYNRVCRSMAFARLYYAERCNRAVLRERGVSTVLFGPMGIGKTQVATSMALSAEIELFDQAFETMLDKALMFPNFPWQRFRDALKRRIERREVVDLDSCRIWIKKCSAFFDYIENTYTLEEWNNRRRTFKFLKHDYTFGYDFQHYKTTYNDELKIIKLFDALEDYACAYLMFTIRTTMLFANYSIRVDSILKDLGNMPYRDNDFFNRSPEYQEAYSRHAHIIDMDMLRLGKKMIDDNPKARRLSYGVYVITEIDKERKNMNELKETKIKTEEVNQKNDLFNACLMMSRHAAVVDNKVYIRFIMDLQRPEAWGAGGRELGEVIYISDKDELAPTLPFFSSYWFTQGVFQWFKGKWMDYKIQYDINRSDKTLFVYLLDNIVSKINNHYDKVNGLFGMQTLDLEIQSGTLEGAPKKEKWRLLTKKDRSKRYRTDCLESVFQSYTPNTMHIDDFIMYANELGTPEENAQQHSYFQNDIMKIKGEKEIDILNKGDKQCDDDFVIDANNFSSIQLSLSCKNNPFVLHERVSAGKSTYFFFNDNVLKFYYWTPENKTHNKIYEARGLQQHYEQYIKTQKKE